MLAERYDAILIDLDGVVYRGDEIIPGVPEALTYLQRKGIWPVFLTNNSSLTPGQVADKLLQLGLPVAPERILTSALATASMLRKEARPGATAFVIGEAGIRAALREAEIEVVDGDPRVTDLVVVGWDRSVDYTKLRNAALLVQRGARLVATNADPSYPAPDGLWPGAGALLAAVTTATGAVPTVVGKPHAPMFRAAAEVAGGHSPLVVGDRLDTDIDGATAMGWDSLLVLSGAATPADLCRSDRLPTYVAPDLSGLLQELPRSRFRGATSEDIGGIAALLSDLGLRSDGVSHRLLDTIVSEDLRATATVQRSGSAGLLRSVAVAKENQGKGIGMLVTAAALAMARRRGQSHVYLFTETAEHFFERMGFEAISREMLPGPVGESGQAIEECAESAVPMVLTLARTS